jgi:hypothetical protein
MQLVMRDGDENSAISMLINSSSREKDRRKTSGLQFISPENLSKERKILRHSATCKHEKVDFLVAARAGLINLLRKLRC